MPIKQKLEIITNKVKNPPQINLIKSKRLSKKWVVVIALSSFLLLMLVLISIFFGNGAVSPGPSSKASPTPVPLRQNLSPPSPYATDSAVLEIEAKLNQLEKDLIEVNLYESELNPPALDMRVYF